jgi:hypothetical protein
VLSVLEDHRIRAAAHGGWHPQARRVYSFDADRPGREQPAEQHPLIAEPQPRFSSRADRASHTVNRGRYLLIELAGRVGATTRALSRRSTRRTGHLSRPATPTGT